MVDIMQDRRAFIRAMMASGGAAAAFMPSIARALEIAPHRRTGTIRDIEHVVILTQENRSFDHYFGTMAGVQGFGDRFAIPAPPLPAAPKRSVFVQPNEFAGQSPAHIAPFRLDTTVDFRLIRPPGTPHSFPDAQGAWDNGRMGHWPEFKRNHTMAHFTRADIPFQYALAEAFTLCDAYHCSVHMGTNPNRLYIWTASHDARGLNNGPALDNGYDHLSGDPRGHGGYTWTTYPERLMAAGISFQVYEDMADNFTDNPLPGFARYRAAQHAKDGPEAELFRRSLSTRTLDGLKADVLAGTLPQVSYIVAPAAWSEHPSVSTPLQGAQYTAQVLDALTANPDVWAKTALFLNFDENDGLFDHVPPPAPPARDPRDHRKTLGATHIGADDEYHTVSQGEGDARYLWRPYGLGPRVPMYVISPWSKGGYVASEVFDHTSVIRFLEQRFGVHEPNISAWRRAVCGDLTSCFDFAHADAAASGRGFLKSLPATAEPAKRAAALKEIKPELPRELTAPVQEKGLRRRRPAPYALDAYMSAQGLVLANSSPTAAAVFHIYRPQAADQMPERYTVAAGQTQVAPLGSKDADLFVLGPNGFHRRFAGTLGAFSARYDGKALHVTHSGAQPLALTLRDCSYGAPSRTITLAPGATLALPLGTQATHGWYDWQLQGAGATVRLAGHVEDGRPSFSDPANGGPAPLVVDSPA